ncbi:LmbU and cloE [Nonomuraea longispora]|uniref:LmbU and cloE n=1 Tax=Nonomuraea longispora TaxID=1848320 RepID=A0A4V2XLG4_9ACTN|nr:LmbU family transcriptional regulator [Nonomuraea longispora]TDC10066.1 LmbU and cloE [Nonomuraea longispora]
MRDAMHHNEHNGTTAAMPTRRSPAAPSRLGLPSTVLTKRVGLVLPQAMPYASWERLGKQIALITDSSTWWLGDWLNYGEKSFPDRYQRAIAGTSLNYQTLRNYAWVARRFPMNRRRDRVSFQHHAELASLAPDEQDEWLDRVEQNRWSRNQLRHQLRNKCVGARVRPQETPVTLHIDHSREERWQQAAGEAQRTLHEWMTMVLDQVADLLLLPERRTRNLALPAGDEMIVLTPAAPGNVASAEAGEALLVAGGGRSMS